jgi:hypothetical protein
MVENAEDLYVHIWRALADCVAEPWSEIRLHIDVIDNSIGLTGEYLRASGTLAGLDVRQLDHSVTRALRQLHKASHRSGTASWMRADFIVKPDGQFRLKLMDEDASRTE